MRSSGALLKSFVDLLPALIVRVPNSEQTRCGAAKRRHCGRASRVKSSAVVERMRDLGKHGWAWQCEVCAGQERLFTLWDAVIFIAVGP